MNRVEERKIEQLGEGARVGAQGYRDRGRRKKNSFLKMNETPRRERLIRILLYTYP